MIAVSILTGETYEILLVVVYSDVLTPLDTHGMRTVKVLYLVLVMIRQFRVLVAQLGRVFITLNADILEEANQMHVLVAHLIQLELRLQVEVLLALERQQRLNVRQDGIIEAEALR